MGSTEIAVNIILFLLNSGVVVIWWFTTYIIKTHSSEIEQLRIQQGSIKNDMDEKINESKSELASWKIESTREHNLASLGLIRLDTLIKERSDDILEIKSILGQLNQRVVSKQDLDDAIKRLESLVSLRYN